MNDQSQNQIGAPTVGFVSHAHALALLLHHSKGHLPAPLLSRTTPGERECFNQAIAHLKFQLEGDEVYISEGIREDLGALSDGRLIVAGNGVEARLYFQRIVDPCFGAGPYQWWLRACTPEEAAERARSGKPLAILAHEAARGIFYLEELCPQAVQLAAGLENNGIDRKGPGRAYLQG